MRTIYKYDLELTTEQTVPMSKNSCILSVDFQESEFGLGLKLWAITDTQELKYISRLIYILPTGLPLPRAFDQIENFEDLSEGTREDCPFFLINRIEIPQGQPGAGEIYHVFEQVAQH